MCFAASKRISVVRDTSLGTVIQNGAFVARFIDDILNICDVCLKADDREVSIWTSVQDTRNISRREENEK